MPPLKRVTGVANAWVKKATMILRNFDGVTACLEWESGVQAHSIVKRIEPDFVLPKAGHEH